MQNDLLKIDAKEEVDKITSFIKRTFLEQKIQNVVIGISGGIDSATSLYLLKNSIPLNNIHPVYLPYFETKGKDIKQLISSFKHPQKQFKTISIKPIVDETVKTFNISDTDVLRKGNVMARVRMIMLYDFAKQKNGLVCGTENKSEHLLGYFTRFGDEASDIEPIRHLYKTQIYELAKYLNVPKSIIAKSPSANLWQGQTDEAQFKFTYAQADPVLYLYFDKKLSIEGIEKQGLPNARKIIEFAKRNSYKHKVPYTI